MNLKLSNCSLVIIKEPQTNKDFLVVTQALNGNCNVSSILIEQGEFEKIYEFFKHKIENK